jgi:2-phosphosulfolactate phosphatase
MGERRGKKIDGFHYGNSPGTIKDTDFSGMTIIQTTGAGTKGIINAIEADEIILGSFVMAEAIVQYILEVNPKVVSLVAMGWNGKIKSIEDEFFADYIIQLLRGNSPVFKNIKKAIKQSPEAAKFFDATKKDFIEDDFHCAMDLNRFNFILKVNQNDLRSVIRLDR